MRRILFILCSVFSVLAFAGPSPRHGQVFSYPNPFKPGAGNTCSLRFEPSVRATLEIYDRAGRKVGELIGSQVDALAGLATWDGGLYNHAMAAPGLYFLVLRYDGGSAGGKLTVSR